MFQLHQVRKVGCRRRGLTLAELLMATAVMSVVAMAIGSVAVTVHSGNEYGQARATVTQHARVVMERIQRTMREAHASEQFPGFVAFGEQSGSWYFPDTVVVWSPESTPADPNGLPRFSEIVTFCPDPARPNRLLEITDRTNSSVVPSIDDRENWVYALSMLKMEGMATQAVMTDILRVAPTGKTRNSASRGAARFEVSLGPSAAEWDAFRNGELEWGDLQWAQGIHGTATGLRQARCRIELQLQTAADHEDATIESTYLIPGSAALYYELRK